MNALRSGPGNGSSHAAQRRDDGIYGRGDEVLGWSVMVKVADGTGEDTWYWLEYRSTIRAPRTPTAWATRCVTGCHGDGTDHVLTPFPLQ